MKILIKLNNLQIIELAKVFLDIGKAIFLGSVVTYFIPVLSNQSIPFSAFLIGLLSSLTLIITGIILLSRGKER